MKTNPTDDFGGLTLVFRSRRLSNAHSSTETSDRATSASALSCSSQSGNERNGNNTYIIEKYSRYIPHGFSFVIKASFGILHYRSENARRICRLVAIFFFFSRLFVRFQYKYVKRRIRSAVLNARERGTDERDKVCKLPAGTRLS